MSPQSDGTDVAPDHCECGGRLEYDGEKAGVISWKCIRALCARIYERFIDTGSGC